MSKEWIGYDFDKSLAYQKAHGFLELGRPIAASVMRIKRFIREGRQVKIFSARANNGKKAIEEIQDWLEDVGLPRLEVTAKKDHWMEKFYDDRAVQLEPNTGRVIKD